MDKIKYIINYLNQADVRAIHLLGKKNMGLYLNENLSLGEIEFDYVRDVLGVYELNFFVDYENSTDSTRDLWTKISQCYSKLNMLCIFQEESEMGYHSIKEVHIMEGFLSKHNISHFNPAQIENIKKKHPHYYRAVKYMDSMFKLEKEEARLLFLECLKEMMDKKTESKVIFKDSWDELMIEISKQEQIVDDLIDLTESIRTRKDLSYLQGVPSTGSLSKRMMEFAEAK